MENKQMETKRELIEAFIFAERKIDYEKIHSYMFLTNWKWLFCDAYRIPTITELKDAVQQLFNTLCHENIDKSSHISTGGFYINLWCWDSGSKEIEIGFNLSSCITSL